MQRSFRKERKSPIVIGENDYGRLSLILHSASSLNETLSETLGEELGRARIVPDTRVPATVIRMGSTVVWRTEAGEARRAELVFPDDADENAGKVSVLTPAGVALIGLSTGQGMEWMTPDGRGHALTVLRVENPHSPPGKCLPGATTDA